MIDLSADRAGGAVRFYLANRLDVAESELRLTELGGGVSNTVLLAEAGTNCWVVKQALGKLRVEQDWFCARERIFRECEAIRRFAGILPPSAVPSVLFEDRENFVFAMTAAPKNAEPWKTQLMRGDVREDIASTVGSYLALWVNASEEARKNGWTQPFDDVTVFVDLRIDPYYRTTAVHHPDLKRWLAALIDECLARRISLVHGDYSPKNLLVSGPSVMIIDFEVMHWGDPSFDAAFLTNHLILKAFHQPRFAASYARAIDAFWLGLTDNLRPGFEWMESAALKHLCALMLARVDGKSPVEYIRDDATRDSIRKAARSMIADPPVCVRDACARILR